MKTIQLILILGGPWESRPYLENIYSPQAELISLISIFHFPMFQFLMYTVQFVE